jgi:hypothetical protein
MIVCASLISLIDGGQIGDAGNDSSGGGYRV